MMYKLLNKLFGWDYIQWKNTVDSGIARIHVDGNGIPYYWRYKITDVADRPDDPFTRIIWLTCNKNKYLPDYRKPG